MKFNSIGAENKTINYVLKYTFKFSVLQTLSINFNYFEIEQKFKNIDLSHIKNLKIITKDLIRYDIEISIYYLLKNTNLNSLDNLYIQLYGLYNNDINIASNLIHLCCKITRQLLYIKLTSNRGADKILSSILNCVFNCKIIIDLTSLKNEEVSFLLFNIASIIVDFNNIKIIYFKFKFNNIIKQYLKRIHQNINIHFYYEIISPNSLYNPTLESIIICKTASIDKLIISHLHESILKINNNNKLSHIIDIIYSYITTSSRSYITHQDNIVINNHFEEYDTYETILYNTFLLLNNWRYFN